jgi:hypothetical protein
VVEVEAERDSVLGAICRVKEKLQSVTDELCVSDLDDDSDDLIGSRGSNSTSTGSSMSSGSKRSVLDEFQSSIRHKESEIQAMRLAAIIGCVLCVICLI